MEQYLHKLYEFRDKLMYMGYWDKIESNWNTIITAVMAAAIVFAILNCFWGYQMMRLWMSIIGLAIGGIIGGYIGLRMFDDKNKIFLIAVVLGMLVAMFANLIYRAGITILCGGIVFLTFELLFPVASMGAHMGFIALGIVAGMAAFAYEDLLVIWVSSICGGLVTARLLLMFVKVNNPFIAIALGAVIAALGIKYQYYRLHNDPDATKRQRKLKEKRGE